MSSLVTLKGAQGAKPIRSMEYLHRAARAALNKSTSQGRTIKSLVTVKGEHGARPILSIEYLQPHARLTFKSRPMAASAGGAGAVLGDSAEGALLIVVKLCDEALHVFQHRALLLAHAVRRQPAWTVSNG